MKVGGGLNYVVGPMGAGKTLYEVRGGVAAMMRGQYWVTNVELREGWADTVAARLTRVTGKHKRQRVADRLRSLYVYETSLAEAMRYRLPGSGEARGRFGWDEGHNDLNNRKWKDDGRAQILEWGTQLRKLGFAGFLLSQHQDNTDAALRRVCNHIVRLQNQREQTRVLGVRATPWPLFIAAWYPAHLALTSNARVKPVKVDRYFLSWHRHLYDTFGLFHGLAGDDSAGIVLLPDPNGRRRATPRSGEAAPFLQADDTTGMGLGAILSAPDGTKADCAA